MTQTPITDHSPFPALPTIRQAAKLTGYPEHLIRDIVSRGLVVSIPAGNRRYVNLDSLLNYINGRVDQ